MKETLICTVIKGLTVLGVTINLKKAYAAPTICNTTNKQIILCHACVYIYSFHDTVITALYIGAITFTLVTWQGIYIGII